MKIKKIIETTFYLALLIFALFLIYQIIRKLLGGSWETQDILIALMILVIGFIFNMTIKLTKLESNFNGLKTSFCTLAKDFKHHCIQ